MVDNIKTIMIKLYVNGISVNLFNKDRSDWIVEYMSYE